jgi:hypothetical protein
MDESSTELATMKVCEYTGYGKEFYSPTVVTT